MEDFDKALNAIKPQRKRKMDDVTLSEQVSQLRLDMLEAAKADIEATVNLEPALAKLNMLSLVLDKLNSVHYHEMLLDGKILEVLRVWLEPYPNNALPNAAIRKGLLESLLLFPIETDYLKESGIGKIVMFMAKNPNELKDIRKLAVKLMNKWARPIIGSSLSYKHLQALEQHKK